MTKTELAGIAVLGTGAIGMAAGVLGFFWRSKRSLTRATPADHGPEFEPSPYFRKGSSFSSHNRRILWAVFLIIIACGLYLRLGGLDSRSISHPEAYVPGIELPAGISEPPPRTSLAHLLFFHFYREPHPPAYYFFMYGWTKVFGTSLFSLRLPSVLFGLMSILLLAMIARAVFSDALALISAALLAFNGHHIYWSQHARMYSMVCFLGLLSVWLLVKYLRERKASSRVWWAFAYVLVSCLGVYTELVFWPLLAGQLLFIWLLELVSPSATTQSRPFSSYLLYCQTLVIMVGAPMWAHAVMTGRQSPLEPLSIDFVTELVSFGFLFERDIFSFPTREISTAVMTVIALVSVLCILSGFLLARNRERVAGSVAERVGNIPTQTNLVARCVVAFFSLIAVVGVSLASDERQQLILVTGLVPVLALVAPAALNRAAALIGNRLVETRFAELLTDGRGLLLCLYVFPVGSLLTVSIFNSLLASRVFLMFTPYLILLISLGVIHLSRNKIVAATLFILLVPAHLGSIYFYSGYPSEVFDYEDLGARLNATARAGDSMLVHNTSWITTPLYYYLDRDRFDIVAENLVSATSGSDVNRVWLVNFEGQPPTKEMLEALSAFQPVASITSRRVEAVLYERVGSL